MDLKNKKYTYSILIPTLLAITMFIVAFYAIIIPMFEKSMMDRKKEMIHELTNTAWSVISEYNTEYKAGSIGLEEAKNKAADEISGMRYGNEQKDYFWIITNEPVMKMHPYRPDLNGKNLSKLTDNHGNAIFSDAVKLVNKKSEGIIHYYWQWKDDSSREVEKLSYVKGYPEWGWIIGTGIYLDDVKQEIKELRSSLLRVSLLIISIIIIILFYVLNQTKLIEEKRKDAVEKLQQSKQKYKSLVGASTEGTLMAVNRKVVFTNNKFLSLLEDNSKPIAGNDFTDIFTLEWNEMISGIETPNKTKAFETTLLNAKPGLKNIVIYVTKVQQHDQTAYIIVVKNITDKKRLRLDKEKLSDDISLSLQLMNQPVKNLVNENIYCSINDRTNKAVSKMSENKTDIICIKNNDSIIGVVTDEDLRNRLYNSKNSSTADISSIMTSPVLKIHQNALLYEAILMFRQNNITHLMVHNNNNDIVGNISYLQCLEMQNNSITFLIKEINNSSHISELKNIYNRVPVLIKSVFTSTDNIASVSRIITSIADAINNRVIEIAITESGEPPCDFAFIAMGSEGRGEQTLKTDQDNAIIFAENSDNNKSYFLSLGETINENLHTIGYSRCEGDLMAGNPEWCNHTDEWKNLFTNWITTPDYSGILDSSIFFDIRCIYGNEDLVNDIWNHIYELLELNPSFFNRLAKTVTTKKLPADVKQIDLKQLLIPITGYLRVNALFNTIKETNSMIRLNHLMSQDIIDENKAGEIESIYNFLMHLRIKWQVDLILDNDLPKNIISAHNLTALELETIKNISKQITKVQEHMKSSFKIVD